MNIFENEFLKFGDLGRKLVGDLTPPVFVAVKPPLKVDFTFTPILYDEKISFTNLKKLIGKDENYMVFSIKRQVNELRVAMVRNCREVSRDFVLDLVSVSEEDKRCLTKIGLYKVSKHAKERISTLLDEIVVGNCQQEIYSFAGPDSNIFVVKFNHPDCILKVEKYLSLEGKFDFYKPQAKFYPNFLKRAFKKLVKVFGL